MSGGGGGWASCVLSPMLQPRGPGVTQGKSGLLGSIAPTSPECVRHTGWRGNTECVSLHLVSRRRIFDVAAELCLRSGHVGVLGVVVFGPQAAVKGDCAAA